MKYKEHSLRHELKYYISEATYHLLRNRIRVVAHPDTNMKHEDGYRISSVYFDDLYQSALEEKNAGLNFRKKYRLRMYENSDSTIKLECKGKYGEYISKTSASLSRVEYDQLLQGNYDFLKFRPERVCHDLLAGRKLARIAPIITVEYLREAYVYPQGNVRITFDKDISASVGTVDIFSEDYTTTKVIPEHMVVIEIKYDDYLPANIHKLLKTILAQRSAISKYVMCRELRRTDGKSQ